jgi:hypothetical protein
VCVWWREGGREALLLSPFGYLLSAIGDGQCVCCKWYCYYWYSTFI